MAFGSTPFDYLMLGPFPAGPLLVSVDIMRGERVWQDVMFRHGLMASQVSTVAFHPAPGVKLGAAMGFTYNLFTPYADPKGDPGPPPKVKDYQPWSPQTTEPIYAAVYGHNPAPILRFAVTPIATLDTVQHLTPLPECKKGYHREGMLCIKDVA
jgi:hypothetical protein